MAAAFQSGSFSPRKAWKTVPEVYSRITGYYRPVKNWNDGKAQEYKDRKVYDIGHSRLTHIGPKENGVTVEAAAPAAACEEKNGDAVYLFATATCPNCKIAAAALDKAGVIFEKILANEQPDMAKQYGIRQAPTLVIVKDGEIEKYAGVSDIKKYLNA